MVPKAAGNKVLIEGVSGGPQGCERGKGRRQWSWSVHGHCVRDLRVTVESPGLFTLQS